MSWPQPWRPWTDDEGHISYTKIIITTFVVLICFGRPIPTTIGIALLAAAFGKSTFEGWIAFKKGGGDDSDEHPKPPIEP